MQQLRTLLLITAILLSGNTVASTGELIVVVSKDNPIDALSKEQVVDLFMGKFTAFPDGRKAMPLDLDNDTQMRANFYKSLVGLPVSHVNAYWSRIKFSGRATPPIRKPSESDIIRSIVDSNSAIGYIKKSAYTKDLKVVYDFRE